VAIGRAERNDMTAVVGGGCDDGGDGYGYCSVAPSSDGDCVGMTTVYAVGDMYARTLPLTVVMAMMVMAVLLVLLELMLDGDAVVDGVGDGVVMAMMVLVLE
jgi:hypothetical protein